MLKSKEFYQGLPKINDYNWIMCDYDTKMHIFQKSCTGGYKVLRLTEEDISESEQFQFMLEYDYSRPQLQVKRKRSK